MNKLIKIVTVDGEVWYVNIDKIIGIRQLIYSLNGEWAVHLDNDFVLTILPINNLMLFENA